MRVDLHNETILSLTDATKAIPPIDGKRPHTSTIWRWCKKGLHGVQLEHLRVGHRVCTTSEALSRFFDQLTEAEQSPPRRSAARANPNHRTAKQRQRDIERAETQCREAGI